MQNQYTTTKLKNSLLTGRETIVICICTSYTTIFLTSFNFPFTPNARKNEFQEYIEKTTNNAHTKQIVYSI